MEENLELLNETLVDRIFEKFEKIPNVNNLYDGKIDDELLNIFDSYKIYVQVLQDDHELNAVRGSYARASKESSYKYIIRLRLPDRKLIQKEERDVINTLLHEFAHLIILRGIDNLAPPKLINKDRSNIVKRIQERFGLGAIPYDFKVDNITTEKAIKFLNYIFDITERPVFAFSIACSCHFDRNEENAQTLFNVNKKYILDYENKRISKESRDKYISRIKDEKIFLFLVQYAVYFLSDRKLILKLDSFMNLIKKYENRFKKLGDEYELSS